MSQSKTARNDPKATQKLRLQDVPELASLSASHPDPKATQVIRLADAPADRSPAPAASVPPAPERASARFSLRAWMARWLSVFSDRLSSLLLRPWIARHKRVLILAAVLVGVAVLVISGVTIKNAQGVQRAAVGSGGLQMRAASLSQTDLSGQDLKWADLSEADLRQANLSGADLLGADLSNADLGEANLESAVLRGADLSGAKAGKAVLAQADLHWAVLRNTDLSEADLRGADLQGADLENANLDGANLEGADMRKVHIAGAVLPDGSVWSPNINLRRFTDPSHPDFWRPGDPQSLASR